jgi:NitT/TauT family transport system substrate-binding protein
MLRRILVASTTLVLIVLAACAPAAATPAPTTAPQPGSSSTSSQSSVPPSSSGTLRIGILAITDVVPFYVAQEQGYFQKNGLNVELVPVSSAAERDQLMITQQIDGMLNDLVSTVIFNKDKPNIRIVRTARSAFSNAPEYWILVPKESTIKTPQDLKGKEIAVSQNTVIEYVTDRLLELEGLSPADVKTTNVPSIPTRSQLLSQNQLTAATLPDPLASLNILQGAHVVIDDSKHPEVGLSVISFRTDIITQRAADVRKFLTAYDQAIQDIRTKPDQFRNTLIDKGRVPDQLKDKYQFPPFPDPSIPSKAQWDDVVKWAQSHQLITSPVTYESSVDSGFIK